MQTHPKSETLNIRASAAEKAKLVAAAQLQHMNVSQFVLHKSLDAAEQVIAEQLIIRVDAPEYDWLVSKLSEPPRDLPELRELFSKPSVFES